MHGPEAALTTTSDDARSRLAALLDRHQAEVSRRWHELAGGRVPVSPGVAATADGSATGTPRVLLALQDRLRDSQGAERAARLRALARDWDDVGVVGAAMAPYFDWLRIAVEEVLAADDAGGEMRAAFEQELHALRLELGDAQSGLLHHERDELESQLEALFEHAWDALVLVDPSGGRIRAANMAACELMGNTEARLRTMTLSDLCPDLTGEALDMFLAEVVDRGRASRQGSLRTWQEGGPEQGLVSALAVRRGGRLLALCSLREVPSGPAASGGGANGTQELRRALSAQMTEIERGRMFFENVISALPIRLVVLDSSLRIIHANPAYYVQRGLTREEVVGRYVWEVFPPELLEGAGLRESLQSVLELGERVRWSGYRYATPDHGERMLNIRLDPCEGVAGERTVLLTLEDITERHRQLYERSILEDISVALLGELELERLLHAILTGMTAGGAVGLGFNRAILMLVDEEAQMLRAEMAVGPESLEQAVRIWTQLSSDHVRLSDFLADFDRLPPPHERPLHDLVSRLVVPLDDTSYLPMLAVAQRETVHVVDAELDERVRPELRELLETDEFVVAPLVARDKTIGAAIADNRFTRQPIDQGAVQLLTGLANQAALAIDTARTVKQAQEQATRLDQALRELRAAQEERVQTARLAAIGEVTAIVAHEIRNPLSAIGGFARSILKRPNHAERNARSAQVIVEEVDRLESILEELLDFTRPTEPQLALVDLNAVMDSIGEQIRRSKQADNVNVVVQTDPEAPLVMADEAQVRQILVNLARNGLEAMPEGGELSLIVSHDEGQVHLSVRDTGQGIPEDRLDLIFETFYTSKPSGTGLGLALCKKLAAQHHAQMTVHSREGEGTQFTVSFPVGARP